MSELGRAAAGEVAGADARPERIVLDGGATVSMQRTDLAVVVEVAGLADGACVESLAPELLALGPDARVVLDVNEATLIHPLSVCDLISELCEAGDDPHRVCLVCDRLSALVLLRRYGAAEHCAIFGTTNDALQAAVLHAEGYGEGWAPSPLP